MIGNRLRTTIVLAIGIGLGVVFAEHFYKACSGSTENGPEIPVYVHDDHAFVDEISQSRRNAIVRAVEAVEPAVVSVNTFFLKERPFRYRDPFFDFFSPFAVLRQKVPGIGSGFVVREDGWILTNDHVIEDAVSISVTLPDHRHFEVKDISRQVLRATQSDVALIHLEGVKGLPTARLGNSDDIIIGEWAIAIGNPFGLAIGDPQPTVTVGVISAKDRGFQVPQDSRAYKKMIQTDAAINRGNSGGPLVNGSGEVIGVNTFIFTEGRGGSVGIGFAIPVNKAKRVMDELLRYGRTREFWTGISVVGMNRWIAARLGIPYVEGALITEVEDNSPGASAGLKSGDVIVAVNGRPIQDDEGALEAFQGGSVGEVFELGVMRKARKVEVDLVLEQDRRRN